MVSCSCSTVSVEVMLFSYKVFARVYNSRFSLSTCTCDIKRYYITASLKYDNCCFSTLLQKMWCEALFMHTWHKYSYIYTSTWCPFTYFASSVPHLASPASYSSYNRAERILNVSHLLCTYE